MHKTLILHELGQNASTRFNCAVVKDGGSPLQDLNNSRKVNSKAGGYFASIGLLQ